MRDRHSERAERRAVCPRCDSRGRRAWAATPGGLPVPLEQFPDTGFVLSDQFTFHIILVVPEKRMKIRA